MSESKKPRAYSYVRFSTPEQQKGDSLRRQVDMAEEYARRNDLELDTQLTFRDLGVSAFRGANAEVGRLAEFRESISAGLVPVGSYLLVESLDRISRQSARSAMNMLGGICDAGVSVVTLSDGRIYTKESLDNDPTSMLMSLLIFIRANEESATKSRRLSAAWANKRSKAADTPITSRCPAWIELEDGKLRLIPKRALVVRRIFRMAAKGWGQHRITQALNSEKVPTFGRAKFWQRSYIVKILANAAAIGTLIPHRVEYRDGKKVRVPLDPILGYYPAVVTKAEFDAINTLQPEAKAAKRGRHANAPLFNVLAGLATCPVCSATMTLTNKGERSRKKFVCTKAKAGGKCRYKSVDYERIEEAFLSDPVGLAKSCVALHPGDEAIERELRDLYDKLSADEEQLESLIEIAGKVRSARVAREIGEIETRIAPLKARSQELRQQRAAMTPGLLKARLKEMVQAISEEPMNKERVNSMLRRVASKVVIDYRKDALRVEWVHGGETIIPVIDPNVFNQ
jgi:DNA invertase Pin-like site-specific DNA recombinase